MQRSKPLLFGADISVLHGDFIGRFSVKPLLRILDAFEKLCVELRCRRNGRFFTDLDEEKLSRLLLLRPELSLCSLWISSDARPERSEEKWLNALLRKTGTCPKP